MARTARFLKDGVCYYIQSQGYQSRTIFKADSDYERYIQLLKKNKLRYQISIYGYCLLPTEVHLIVHPRDAGKLPIFMQGINQSYAMSFNMSHRRVGKVWGQRYKSNVICDDCALIEKLKMVEFLPVRTNKVRFPMQYSWSSCSFRVMGGETIIDSFPPTCETSQY